MQADRQLVVQFHLRVEPFSDFSFEDRLLLQLQVHPTPGVLVMSMSLFFDVPFALLPGVIVAPLPSRVE